MILARMLFSKMMVGCMSACLHVIILIRKHGISSRSHVMDELSSGWKYDF